MALEKFLTEGGKEFLPNLSVDIVIIGYQQQTLKCLLARIGSKWMLPGGFIGSDEAVESAVARVMKQRTGLEDPHLRFLAVFGAGNRNFGKQWKAYIEKAGVSWQEDSWINTRFVTLAYYSLVDMAHAQPEKGAIDEAIGWFPLDDLPDMWMDHAAIATRAREQLKTDIRREHITHNLLPEPFTMPELHQLHQTILEEKLDRSRFQKKLLATGLLERLPKRQKDSPGRNPYQYRLKEGG